MNDGRRSVAPLRRPGARRRPRRRPWRLVLTLAGLAIAFVAGIGLGEALHDNPKAGTTQTLVRTLHPLPLVPIVRDTVTITTVRP